MGDRVRIGVCSGPADAAIVRAMLSAHGIESVVGGEHHANLLGGLGGALIALDISVAAEDGDEAFELLREFRAGEAEGEPPDSADEPEAEDSGPDLALAQRKKAGVALLLSCFVSFGTGHMYARSWGPGFVLAGVEVGGIAWLASGHPAGGAMVLGSILADAIGAVWRIRRGARTNLPVARTR